MKIGKEYLINLFNWNLLIQSKQDTVNATFSNKCYNFV